MELTKIKVIPKAKRNAVQEEEGRLRVRVTAPAVGGKANNAVIALLAEHFGVKKSKVKIVRGEKSREKLVRIERGS